MQPVLREDHDLPRYSLVVPIYGNESGIPALIDAVGFIARELDGDFEAIFVVDGSPDHSYARLRETLPEACFNSQLIALNRNFGAFAAIRAGLGLARGAHIAVMAADLQEPPELALTFFRELSKGEHDVAFGVRLSRDDPWHSKIMSSLFWWTYRRLVMPDIPAGGVDIFALQSHFRDDLLSLQESNSSLLAQLFWLGGRRLNVGYQRVKRQHGKSAWTLKKRFRYLTDSIFSFTNLPIRVMTFVGAFGMVAAAILGAITLMAKATGTIDVPGYAGIVIAVLFFGALNSFGIGIVGTYAWRAFENTKARPLAIIQTKTFFKAKS